MRGAITASLFCLLFGGLPVRADLIPVATTPPGDLTREETPQFIFVTFDDAVNPDIFEMIGRISDHQHADGSPVGFTFFVSTNWTDYYLVHQLHAQGHEIAVHTMTHTTGTGTDFLTWVREIEGCREALHRLAGVPLEELRGFRAPYLAYNGATYEALHELGFDYSTSVSEPLGMNSHSPSELIWPYTLHDGLQQLQWTGEGPTSSLPNLMEVPMWLLFEEDGSRHAEEMDPVGSRESLVALFKRNFTQRYEGNRAPLGIWLHAAPWLGSPGAPRQGNVDAINEFLAWALEKPDVWVVGVGTAVDWMKHPLPADEAAASGMLSPKTFEPVPESEAISNSFATGHFKSVGNRALAYPAPDNIFERTIDRKQQVSGVELEVVATNVWSATGFQGEIRIRNTNDFPIESWSVIWTPGPFEVGNMWGSAAREDLDDGRIRLSHHSWSSPEIPAGGQITATFGGTGSAEELGSLEGEFSVAVSEPPRFEVSLNQGAHGELQFRWDRKAPIYHLQKTQNLFDGQWETVETIYGQTEFSMPRPASGVENAVFYRVKTAE